MNSILKIAGLFSCFAGFLFVCSGSAFSQFAPAAGQPGSTAVDNDSNAIVRWANEVIEFKRGAADIANGWGTLAAFGDSTEALGYAQGNSTDVVSLGDSGYVTLGFPFPIMNGPGNDFAIFENSFSDDYLEFAHVEVSSDGINFIRFPGISLNHSGIQTGPFENSITENIHNLAGKYRQGYGTPFDLEDLADSAGINLDSVLYVRVVDVIGSIDPAFGTEDSQGDLINDPYPTDFAAGGFDLDGVGVMNENNIYASVREELIAVSIYPNPSQGNFRIQSNWEEFDLLIIDMEGQIVFSEVSMREGIFELEACPGMYLIKVVSGDAMIIERLIIQ
jgi:hypothetical protein